MNQIPRCDLLPERARWRKLPNALCPARRDILLFIPYKTEILVRSRWLDIGFVLFCVSFMDLDSGSVHLGPVLCNFIPRPSPLGTTMHSGKDSGPSKLGTSKMAAQLTDEVPVRLFSLFC